MRVIRNGVQTILVGAIAMLPVLSSASALEDYLQTRSQYGITTAAGTEALQTFVGERVMEIQGVVKGSIGREGDMTLILALPTRGTINLKATDVPSWMRVSNVAARIIVKATRTAELAPLRADLIAAMPETTVAQWEISESDRIKREAEAAAAAELQRQQQAQQRNTTSTTSRNGRPPRMPGDVPPVQRDPVLDVSSLAPALQAVVPDYAAFIRQRNSRLSAAQAQEIAIQILGYSARFGVDARLIMALVLVESNFNPNAVSSAGARGLGQLMPGTARGLGVSNSFNTDQNLNGTVKLITQHINTYTNSTGDPLEGLVLALAAYNAGPGAVRRHGGVPPYRETQNYVQKVIATYRELCGE
ncbi:MAG: lytic transglycosylase domain-containing protein [Fimbriimonadaceae bacterium]|nr:lytic transglycosylase domain-containing protein [Fimbriimonadaceae bacterium]